MRIHHFDATTLCPVSARLVQGAGGWLDPARLVCHCWLIESRRGLVLVDTGLGAADLLDVRRRLGRWFELLVRPRGGPGATALEQVRRLGFRAEDVRDVVVTHLDLDHAGGLPDFPSARVHVFRPEHEAAMAPATARERARYRAVHWAHRPRWELHDVAGDRWFDFEAVRALGGEADPDQEVLLVPLPGHTRGHAAVAARDERGWALHAGDAYFFHGEVEGAAPCPPGLSAYERAIGMDGARRRANQARLRELLARNPGEIRIHSAHCPVELERWRTGGDPERPHGARPRHGAAAETASADEVP
jgi:glyoxylase-like metal-dependent hydrolase (beta-lactamase superfamily II)